MLRYRIIPTLLLRGSGLVKTRHFKNPVYIGDPINAVKIFNDKEVDELIILDISATNDKAEIRYDYIEDIVSEAFMPVGYGGGICRIDQIETLFKRGVEKVVLNTSAHINRPLISEAAKIFGSQSIVAAIDIHRDLFGRQLIFTHAATKKHNINLPDSLRLLEDAGAGEIVINSIDSDGTMEGYDLDLIRHAAGLVSIPVIASGGAGKIEHFKQAIDAGASAVAAGAMFVFQGIHRAVLISYPQYEELEKLMNIKKE